MNNMTISHSLFNPLNHLRFLWWIFVDPKAVINYQNQYGERMTYIHRQWIYVTIFWLPFLVSAIGMVVGTIPLVDGADKPYAIVVLIGIISAWLFLGWFRVQYKKPSISWFVDTFLGVIAAIAVGRSISNLYLVEFITAVCVLIAISGLIETRLHAVLPLWVSRVVFILLVSDFIYLVGFSFFYR